MSDIEVDIFSNVKVDSSLLKSGLVKYFNPKIKKDSEKPKHSHYHKDVSAYQTMDIYALCKVWNAEPSGCTHLHVIYI